jgi:hypothetical protein
MPYGAGDRLACTRCGGALDSEVAHCLCGGRSQYYIPAARSAPEPEPEPEERRRPLHWTEAMAILRRRYVPR